MQPGPLDAPALARLARAAPARLGGVRLVVVDGPAGSGKTTCAARLDAAVAALGSSIAVVHMDDLYEGWSGLEQGVWHRLRRQVLGPLAAGRAARYQVYDWDAARFDAWVDLPVPDVLVLEGVGSGAQPLDAQTSLRVWVEVPPDLRLARGLERDGEALRAEWLRWAEREQAHFAGDRTRERADVLVDGAAAPVG